MNDLIPVKKEEKVEENLVAQNSQQKSTMTENNHTDHTAEDEIIQKEFDGLLQDYLNTNHRKKIHPSRQRCHFIVRTTQRKKSCCS